MHSAEGGELVNEVGKGEQAGEKGGNPRPSAGTGLDGVGDSRLHLPGQEPLCNLPNTSTVLFFFDQAIMPRARELSCLVILQMVRKAQRGTDS